MGIKDSRTKIFIRFQYLTAPKTLIYGGFSDEKDEK